MSLADEAELTGLFISEKDMVKLSQTLIEIGWSQPRTPLQTNNSTAVGVTNNTIVSRCTKYMDMRFYWLLCREYQYLFRYYWYPASSNLADYITKHHPPMHHESHRPTHVGLKVGYKYLLQWSVAA